MGGHGKKNRKHPKAHPMGKTRQRIIRSTAGRQMEKKKLTATTPATSTWTVGTDGLKPQDNTATVR